MTVEISIVKEGIHLEDLTMIIDVNTVNDKKGKDRINHFYKEIQTLQNNTRKKVAFKKMHDIKKNFERFYADKLN